MYTLTKILVIKLTNSFFNFSGCDLYFRQCTFSDDNALFEDDLGYKITKISSENKNQLRFGMKIQVQSRKKYTKNDLIPT